jgi:4-carboxymuconolactone decarboxylase
VRVDDAVLARLAAGLGPRQVVELVVTIGAYNMVSRFLVAFDIVDEP